MSQMSSFYCSALHWINFACALKSGKLQDSDVHSPAFKGVRQTPVYFPLPQTKGLNFPLAPREDSQSPLPGADTVIVPVWYKGDIFPLPPASVEH